MALKCDQTNGLLMVVCLSAADCLVPHTTSVQIAVPTCTSSHALSMVTACVKCYIVYAQSICAPRLRYQLRQLVCSHLSPKQVPALAAT